MSTYIFELENGDNELHPKDVVDGKLVCIFSRHTFIRGMSIELVGEESTKFLKIVNHNTMFPASKYRSSRRSMSADIRTEESKGYNKFLSISKTLCSEETFGPGSHDLSFSFLLPENIPGTYESNRGFVKFFLRVTREVDSSTQENIKEIKVVAPLCNPEYAWFESNVPAHRPYSQSAEKFLSSTCCLGNPAVVIDLYLPKRAFIQGERVPIQVDVTNTSDQQIERLEVILGETIQSKGGHPDDGLKYDHEVLAVIKTEGVKSYGEKTYEISLAIPTTPVVPNFTGCKLFSQKCWIDVIAVMQEDFTTKLTTWVLVGQTNPGVEQDIANEVQRLLIRNNSRVRDPLVNHSPRSLLPSRGPAPYSSFRQRPTGFDVGQPITSPVRITAIPLPPDRHTSSTSEAYPPVTGPQLSLPDVPTEDPPCYEDVISSEVHSSVTRSPQLSRDIEPRRRLAIAEAAQDVAPSAPCRSPDVESRHTPLTRGMSGSAPYPPAPVSVSSDWQIPAMPMPLPSVAPYPPQNPPASSIGSYTSMPMPPHHVSFSQNLPTSYTSMPMPSPRVSSTHNPSESSVGSYTSMPMPPPQVSSTTYSPMHFPRTAPYPPGPPSSFANIAPYPPATSAVSSSYHPMPFPKTTPYTPTPSTGWDLIRAAMPDMIATHRASSSTLYPPEKPPPLTINPTSMPMPMPVSNATMYLPSSGQTDVSNSASYLVEHPLQVCGAIGFTVLENASKSRPSSLHSTASNEERSSNAHS